MRDVVIGRPSAEFLQWCALMVINVNSGFPMLRTQLEASCATQQITQATTQNPTQSGAEIGESDGITVIRLLLENEKGPEFPGLSVPIRYMHGMASTP